VSVSASSAWAVASNAVLVVLLAAACASDVRTRRIPNQLVLITAVFGFVAAVVTKPWLGGLRYAGEGLLVGLAIWLPFYALRMLGAGDVKLFAAAATFLGPRDSIEGALYTALFGGVVALAFMLAQSGWASTLIRANHAIQQPTLLRQPSTSARRMPYALAIAAGVLTALWWPGHIIT
jgi:prepilin peptidase CpaA